MSPIRKVTVHALGELVKAAPQHGEDALNALVSACSREEKDADVRRAAARALGELARAAPLLAPRALEAVLKALNSACSDKKDLGVREVAAKVLGHLARALPKQRKDALNALVSVCSAKEKDDDVRYAAAEALGELTKAAPWKADDASYGTCLKALVSACSDKDRRVCEAAASALESYTTRQFIEDYCRHAAGRGVLLPRLINRLYTQVLVINGTQLTLNQAVGVPEQWQMPLGQVDILKRGLCSRHSDTTDTICKPGCTVQ